MIHSITLSNFYSFRDKSVISLQVADTAPFEPSRLVSPSAKSKRFPLVVGLYGPNASGKSTILRAIAFVTTFLEHGFALPPDSRIPCYRFASAEMSKKPVEIEIEFDAPLDLESRSKKPPMCPYTYRLVLGGAAGAQPSRIEQEVLWRHDPDAFRRIKLFERHSSGLVSRGNAFDLQGLTRTLKRILRPNVTLITTLSQLGHAKSERLLKVAAGARTNVGLFPQAPGSYSDGVIAERYLADAKMLGSLNDYITKLDLGISKVAIVKAESERTYPEAHYHHHGMEKPLHISSESQGTRHFFRIFPIIFDAFATGGIATIDEMDSSIHALLLPEIISWFWDRKRNPNNAQLWFTCQNPWLLQQLLKEEILFTEKDAAGGSTAFGLSEIKGARRNEDYMKKYLGGAYGALPHFG